MAERTENTPVRESETRINEAASVIGASELGVAAAPEIVWDVLTGLDRWPSWNPDVKSMSFAGPVAVGSEFRWKAGPATIRSRITRVEPPRLIVWTGRTLGIDAVHVWHLEPRNGGTFVRTAESYDGLLARVLRKPIQATLDRALEDGLRHLKAEAERRAAGEAGDGR